MKKIHNGYSSSNMVQRSTEENKKDGTRSTLCGEINAYKIVLQKPEGKRSNKGLKCGWQFKEMECRRDSIGSEQGPVAESSESCDELLRSMKSKDFFFC
jgi:hypothetical protein